MAVTLIAAIAITVVALIRHLYQVYRQRNARSHSAVIDLQDLKSLKIQHNVHSAFMTLINDEGAGSWPPKATHDNFPPALRPYAEVFMAVAPYLANSNPSLDDEFNKRRCREFRTRMQTCLAELVDLQAARQALDAVEQGSWDDFPRDAYNGFYSCIASLRHAYRWATNPVVKVAQEEKQLQFPVELDVAWSYIQRRFDITSPSGNIMANCVCNLDSNGQIVYHLNVGMSDLVRSTELAFLRLFYDTESLANPIYYALIQAIVTFERGDKKGCLAHAEQASIHLRKVVQMLYEKMHDPNIARSVWVRHVSGILSWGLSHEVDGSLVTYGGLSGSQILLFLVVDAFLGIDRYHSDDELKMHIPHNMRHVAATVRTYSFRSSLSEKNEDDVEIEKTFIQMVKQLRSFRAVHKVRAIRYLSAPAPERIPMTAALSVLPEEGEKVVASDPYDFLDVMLTKRMNETV